MESLSKTLNHIRRKSGLDSDDVQETESVPTPEEIDEAIIELEIRSEDISHGGNADILLEEE